VDWFFFVKKNKNYCIFDYFLNFSDLGEELNCLAFDGQTMIVGGGSGCLSVWDICNGKPMGKIPAHKGKDLYQV
jgi:WD40 repeat protein